MEKNNNAITIIVGVVLVCLTLISCVTLYQYNQSLLIQSNIESAIAKGIDPIAVRCAYAYGSDALCVAYTLRHGKMSEPSTPSAPKLK